MPTLLPCGQRPARAAGRTTTTHRQHSWKPGKHRQQGRAAVPAASQGGGILSLKHQTAAFQTGRAEEASWTPVGTGNGSRSRSLRTATRRQRRTNTTPAHGGHTKQSRQRFKAWAVISSTPQLRKEPKGTWRQRILTQSSDIAVKGASTWSESGRERPGLGISSRFPGPGHSSALQPGLPREAQSSSLTCGDRLTAQVLFCSSDASLPCTCFPQPPTQSCTTLGHGKLHASSERWQRLPALEPTPRWAWKSHEHPAWPPRGSDPRERRCSSARGENFSQSWLQLDMRSEDRQGLQR